jgi:hypothetical protein
MMVHSDMQILGASAQTQGTLGASPQTRHILGASPQTPGVYRASEIKAEIWKGWANV